MIFMASNFVHESTPFGPLVQNILYLISNLRRHSTFNVVLEGLKHCRNLFRGSSPMSQPIFLAFKGPTYLCTSWPTSLWLSGPNPSCTNWPTSKCASRATHTFQPPLCTNDPTFCVQVVWLNYFLIHTPKYFSIVRF